MMGTLMTTLAMRSTAMLMATAMALQGPAGELWPSTRENVNQVKKRLERQFKLTEESDLNVNLCLEVKQDVNKILSAPYMRRMNKERSN
jgi:hypothetical protein